MNRILFGVFALGLVFAVAQAQLQCYKCDLGVFGACINATTTCQSGEQCFLGVGKAVGFVSIIQKGCLTVSNCNRTTDVPFALFGSNSTLFKMTKTCCSTNLCNLAPRGAYGSLLSIALVTLAGAMINGALV